MNIYKYFKKHIKILPLSEIVEMDLNTFYSYYLFLSKQKR